MYARRIGRGIPIAPATARGIVQVTEIGTVIETATVPAHGPVTGIEIGTVPAHGPVTGIEIGPEQETVVQTVAAPA